MVVPSTPSSTTCSERENERTGRDRDKDRDRDRGSGGGEAEEEEEEVERKKNEKRLHSYSCYQLHIPDVYHSSVDASLPTHRPAYLPALLFLRFQLRLSRYPYVAATLSSRSDAIAAIPSPVEGAIHPFPHSIATP
jgi:hypothetical protein